MHTLQDLYDFVWKWRKENDWFPTPEPMDSISYAVTEIAEAIDADLRSRRTEDKRNRDIEAEDPRDELADAAIMIITAMPPDDEDVLDAIDNMQDAELLPSKYMRLEVIASIVFDLYHFFSGWRADFHFSIMSRCAFALANMMKFDEHLTERVSARLKRIEEKRK